MKFISINLIVIGLVILSCLRSNAQSKSLKIGDKIPNLKLTSVNSACKLSINSSELNGKIIILDFGNVACESCVASLPHLDSIQKAYAGKLQIFWVLSDSLDVIKSFLNKNHIGRKLKLPVIADRDSSLRRLFQPKKWPEDIWVNGKGVFTTTTGPEQVDPQNIDNFLKENKIATSSMTELPYDNNQGFMVLNNKTIPIEDKPSIIYNRTLTSYIPRIGGPTYIKPDTVNKVFNIHLINAYIEILYKDILKLAYSTVPDEVYQRSHLILEVKDKDRILPIGGFSEMDNENWYVKNEYCYDASFPLNTPKQKIGEMIMQDFNFYFGINGRMESRIVDCWILKQTDRLKLNQKVNESDILVEEDELHSLTNKIPLSFLIDKMETRIIEHVPIIDETGLNYQNETEIFLLKKFGYPDYSNIASVNKVLAPLGFELTVEKRSVPMLVISDTNNKIN